MGKILGEAEPKSEIELDGTVLPPLESVACGEEGADEKENRKRSVESKFFTCFEIMLLIMCRRNIEGL